jgi:hypothetical protein
MALEESDLDRIADKIELSVTRAINAAMDKHIRDTHGPCEKNCDARMTEIEKSQSDTDKRIYWGMGALAGLSVAWELLKKKLGV